MRGEEGFSLIEMLVALAIVALATGMVIFTGGGRGQLAAETDRFIASLAAARDQALIENRLVTVEVSDDGYQTRVHSRLGLTAPAASPAIWEQGTSVATTDGRLPALLTFDPVGLTEPARLTLFRDGAVERIAVEASGEIRRVADAE
jgi:general secretion pathway protein H